MSLHFKLNDVFHRWWYTVTSALLGGKLWNAFFLLFLLKENSLSCWKSPHTNTESIAWTQLLPENEKWGKYQPEKAADSAVRPNSQPTHRQPIPTQASTRASLRFGCNTKPNSETHICTGSGGFQMRTKSWSTAACLRELKLNSNRDFGTRCLQKVLLLTKGNTHSLLLPIFASFDWVFLQILVFF